MITVVGLLQCLQFDKINTGSDCIAIEPEFETSW